METASPLAGLKPVEERRNAMTAKETTTSKEPNVISRAIADLEEHFERGEDGKHTGYERPEVEAEEEPDPTTLDADDFHDLNERFERDKEKRREEQREAAAEKRKERVEKMLDRHVDDERWTDLMRQAPKPPKPATRNSNCCAFPASFAATAAAPSISPRKAGRKRCAAWPRNFMSGTKTTSGRRVST